MALIIPKATSIHHAYDLVYLFILWSFLDFKMCLIHGKEFYAAYDKAIKYLVIYKDISKQCQLVVPHTIFGN